MSARIYYDELSLALSRFDKRVFTVLASMNDQDILNQQVACRVLAGCGFIREAIIVLQMERHDYEMFLANTCGDAIDQVVS